MVTVNTVLADSLAMNFSRVEETYERPSNPSIDRSHLQDRVVCDASRSSRFDRIARSGRTDWDSCVETNKEVIKWIAIKPFFACREGVIKTGTRGNHIA